MNDGPYNWCTQHSAWGSWISRLEHTAKLICFVRDGRRGEGRLLSFRQERSTWCQERRRCSSCCLCCNPTTPPPHSHTSALSSPQTLEHTHQHIPPCTCVHTLKHTPLALNLLDSCSTKLGCFLDNRPQPHAEPMPLCHNATLFSLPGIFKGRFKYSSGPVWGSLDVTLHTLLKILVTTFKSASAPGNCNKAKPYKPIFGSQASTSSTEQRYFKNSRINILPLISNTSPMNKQS